MPMVWSVGAVFGPAFGGFFARPAEQFPRLFGNSKLLIQFPFLLPNLIAGIFFMCSLVTAVLFLRVCISLIQEFYCCNMLSIATNRKLWHPSSTVQTGACSSARSSCAFSRAESQRAA